MIENFKFIETERRAYKVVLMKAPLSQDSWKMAESKGASQYV